MSLRDASLMYVFYETSSLSRQRKLCEHVIGLPVIENQFYPPHEYHGLVKYDAGQVILSLNLTKGRRFKENASDGLVTVLSVENKEAVIERWRQQGYALPQGVEKPFTDAYGHHYIFREAGQDVEANGRPFVQELRLVVSDFGSSLAFYRDILGLELVEQTGQTARFATGTADILIQQSQVAPDGRPIVRYHTYLIVFYTAAIYQTRDELARRGVARHLRVGSSDIGLTARFKDPSGHIFCLYRPSEESLTWDSGPKVLEIANAGVTTPLSA